MIIVQIIVAVIIVSLVLVQQRGTGFGVAAFGGSHLSYGTKQGAEKMIFWLTIFFTILFVLLSLANLLMT